MSVEVLSLLGQSFAIDTTMKRIANQEIPDCVAETTVAKIPRRITTRAITRAALLRAQEEIDEANKEQARFQNAVAMMSSPLLQVLPLVLGQSGFLYKRDVRNAAFVCKS